MKIALAQLNPTVGDLSGNRVLVEEAARQAADAGAELLVCPEMVLTGYPPMDLLGRAGFVDEQIEQLRRLEAASEHVALAVGAVLRAP
jgi:NAD+ synthase (glutamine-hydrolysing)